MPAALFLKFSSMDESQINVSALLSKIAHNLCAASLHYWADEHSLLRAVQNST